MVIDRVFLFQRPPWIHTREFRTPALFPNLASKRRKTHIENLVISLIFSIFATDLRTIPTILLMNTKTFRLNIVLLIAFVLLAILYILDFNRIDTVSKIEQKGVHTGEDYMLSSLNVTAISQDNQQRIWIGTSAGLNVYDGHDYLQFFHAPKDSTALPDDYINVLHKDRAGNMWIGTQNGLARYEGGYRFKRFPIPDADDNITIIKDTKDATDPTTVLVGNGKSWYKVNQARIIGKSEESESSQSSHISENYKNPLLSDSSILQKPKELISSVFKDAGGNLWVGFHNAGYRVISKNVVTYTKANDNQLAEATKGKDITSLERVGKYILAGTTLRLYTYNTKTDHYTYTLYRDLFDASPTPQNNAETVARQEINNMVAYGDDKAWVINDHQIVSCQLSGSNMHIVNKTTPNKEQNWLLGTGTKVNDAIYVSCDGGYIVKNKFGTSSVERIPVNNEWYGSDTQMTPLHNGDLMLFMRNMHVAILSIKTHQLTNIEMIGLNDDVTNIDPAFVRQDSYGNVWLGTRRTGLYKLTLNDHHVERMTFIDDVHIQGLTEDKHHRLWITTLKEAICYQPNTGAVLLNSLVSSRMNNWNRQFFDLAICLAPDDNVLLGSSDGCIYLPANSGKDDTPKGELRIASIDIKNTNGDELTINDHIKDEAKYTLSHNEKAVTFRFFYPNYNRSSSLMYQYMLEGYDQTWRQPSYKNTAYFANLTPGNYTFRVRLVSSPNLPPVATCNIHVRVKHSPWNSAAAWLFYLVCLGYLIYYLNSLYLKVKTDRMQLLQEKHEREREQRTNEMNMSFFANISHEFRNPITLIAGPLVSLKADDSLPTNVRKTLNVVCVSVNRMLRLIDQMLDFNQLETDALRLKVSSMDVSTLLRNQETVFAEPARLRGIMMEMKISEGNYEGFADADKLEKILSNLFTNALKHTPDGGKIIVTASILDNDVSRPLEITVFNSGSHISEERLDDVFKRYYQLDNTDEKHHYGWGTGIGLYYVKRLVGLHHGTIGVNNTLDGVEFRFTIPIGKEAYNETLKVSSEEKVMQIPTDRIEDTSLLPPTSPTSSKEKGTALKRTKILIVDDDIDVAQYIRSLFVADYDVDNRYSAEAALQDMEQIQPDIIVSDIIMGEMSGYDFCHALKENLMYSHIPIILVTAKSNMDEQIKGLQQGAIAYVTKPFDPAYLRAIVQSQLGNMKSLRKRLGENVDTSSLTDTLSEQDRKFMDELYALMEKRAGEMELNVATMCRDLLISQSKFTYKLRELTGETPGTFFRKFKLNKAAQMLREGKYTVSEIATLTGFSTAAHFSVAFKKQFGETPSEYARTTKG